MSSQGCEIITDPDMIKQTDVDSFLRSRFRNIKGLPLYEPWFAKKCLYEVECMLLNHYHIDGYFLVRPEFQGEKVYLMLSVVFNDSILHFKILQVKSYVYFAISRLISHFLNFFRKRFFTRMYFAWKMDRLILPQSKL